MGLLYRLADCNVKSGHQQMLRKCDEPRSPLKSICSRSLSFFIYIDDYLLIVLLELKPFLDTESLRVKAVANVNVPYQVI